MAGLWQDMKATDPAIAYAAVCTGATARDAAVAQLKAYFRPAGAVDVAVVAKLIGQLDADQFTHREEASRALAALGPEAEAVVGEALKKSSLAEVKTRLEDVLRAYAAEHRRHGFALELLEMIGTPAAKNLLADLAGGASGTMLTREARATLTRLDKRP